MYYNFLYVNINKVGYKRYRECNLRTILVSNLRVMIRQRVCIAAHMTNIFTDLHTPWVVINAQEQIAHE